MVFRCKDGYYIFNKYGEKKAGPFETRDEAKSEERNLLRKEGTCYEEQEQEAPDLCVPRLDDSEYR